ncbi:MAG: 5-formyltetrahydrofolate cyclo-ligase [Lachnospiraceae bacterium]|nr:5-formyltetrahydrofolate cyclo-ligase [Lachnospiraceae bacterium]
MDVSLNDGKDLADEKKRIRREALSVRDMLSQELRQEKSSKILQTIYEMEIYKITNVILCYVDYQSEVITTPLIERAIADGKKVFCPKVSGTDMEFYRIIGVGELKAGYKGIKEPVGSQDFLDFLCERDDLSDDPDAGNRVNNKTLVIIPGSAFDKGCHRMGYGKGFYDKYLTRLLENNIDVYMLGLGYECQLIDKVPCEAHDIVLDMLVTEENIYRRKI